MRSRTSSTTGTAEASRSSAKADGDASATSRRQAPCVCLDGLDMLTQISGRQFCTAHLMVQMSAVSFNGRFKFSTAHDHRTSAAAGRAVPVAP
eukprot:6814980-Prymnesium_polylepis.1